MSVIYFAVLAAVLFAWAVAAVVLLDTLRTARRRRRRVAQRAAWENRYWSDVRL